jgi:hypothetical protein
MAVFKYKIQIIQGETYNKIFPWKAGASSASVIPVDLTGCTAKMQIRSKVNSPDVLLELSTQNSKIILSGITGEVKISLSASETSAITWNSGVYDLKIQFPDGSVRRLLSGTVSVSTEITK